MTVVITALNFALIKHFTLPLTASSAVLLRRCREMIEVGGSHAAQFPRALQKIFQSALRLRERRDQGQLSEPGLAVARGQLESRMDRLLSKPRRSPQNQRLANHVWRERDALFTFLSCSGLEATQSSGTCPPIDRQIHSVAARTSSAVAAR
jgi:hypothetical protein